MNRTKKYTRDYGVNIKVVGNKISGEKDIAFLKEKVGNDLVATLSESKFVRQTDFVALLLAVSFV